MLGSKPQNKTEALLQRYGLEDLSDPRDLEAVKSIAHNLSGNKLIALGAVLQGNGVDNAKMTYMSAIMEQNFIIIRQLDRLNRNLENK